MASRPLALIAALAAGLAAAAPAAPRLVTEDLDRFWAVWDATGGKPDTAALQKGYLAPGSAGLKDFLALRIQSADRLAKLIAAYPAYYAGLRRTTAALPAASVEIRAALERMHALYPRGELPSVYFLIGAMNSGGTTSDAGLLIGVDMYGKHPDTDLSRFGAWHRSVLAGPELLPAIVVHELVHTLQRAPQGTPTLLEGALREGIADLLTARAYGRHINAAAHAWGMANECTLWREFTPRMGGTDYAGFLYGGQAEGRPADLGYFIGYRIGEAYLAKHGAGGREAQAIAALLEHGDAGKVLAASGYAPCGG
jgi:hypothetical protein